jgi:diguanylate cyclase (GGDEF)-like protein
MISSKELVNACTVEGIPFIVTASSTLALLGGLTTLICAACNAALSNGRWAISLVMTPTVAMLFTLVGMALWSFLLNTSASWRSFVVRGAGLAIVLVSTVAWASDLFREEVGLRENMRQRAVEELAIGRLEPATAVAFILLGTALFWLPSAGVWPKRTAQCLLLTTLFISSIAVARAWYGTETLHATDPYTSIPVTTALILLFVSIGMLYARRDFELMMPLRSQRMGGVLARTSLPGIAASPLMLGWFFLKGEQLELYGFESAVAVHAVAMVAVLARVTWYSARTLNEVDRQQEDARQRERDLRILSDLDPLTGVLNRRSLRDRLDREWSRAQRSGQPLSCIMLDIDHFKVVNDTHGHTIGDTVLKRVATILMQQCRPADILARYGGEEFCVIAPEASELGAVQLAERLRTALEDSPVDVAEGSLIVTASFGVAVCQGERDRFDSLVDRADQALIHAKREGRNRVVAASRDEVVVRTKPAVQFHEA